MAFNGFPVAPLGSGYGRAGGANLGDWLVDIFALLCIILGVTVTVAVLVFFLTYLFGPYFKKPAAAIRSVWQKVRERCAAVRRPARFEMRPSDQWPSTATDRYRRTHWREKILSSLSKKGRKGSRSNTLPRYEELGAAAEFRAPAPARTCGRHNDI